MVLQGNVALAGRGCKRRAAARQQRVHGLVPDHRAVRACARHARTVNPLDLICYHTVRAGARHARNAQSPDSNPAQHKRVSGQSIMMPSSEYV